MATGKRYYWIKLKDSFMSSDMIDYLMGQPDGANYVVLYQMLCLKTINTGGRLAFQIGDMIIPYDVEKIQRECKWFSLATVRVALEVYKQIGLIYEDKDGVLVLANYSDIVGSETDYSAQKRLQRENRRRQLPPKCADSNEDNNVDNVHTEKEIEIDKEKEIYLSILDKDQEKNLSTFQQQPTLSEIEAFAKKEGIHTDIQKFYNYYSERGWKTKNGQPITNWKGTLAYWGKTDGTCQGKRKSEPHVSENAEAYERIIDLWENGGEQA